MHIPKNRKRKTWKVLDTRFKGDGGKIDLICPNCTTDAVVPTKGRASIIAVIGLRLVMADPGSEPPPGFLPDAIQCRSCRRIYAEKEGDKDVREAI